MTSAVLYGTTSDNILKPVRVTDSGEFVTDGGGGGDWYANLYVGGTEGAPSISLLSDGSFTGIREVLGDGVTGSSLLSLQSKVTDTPSTATNVVIELFSRNTSGEFNPVRYRLYGSGDIYSAGDVYAKSFIDSDGYDVGKIGQALSTIHDVIESVDDLQGLKNLFHLLLDNLKSDVPPPTPPTPPTP